MRDSTHLKLIKERRRLQEHRAETKDVVDALAATPAPDFKRYNDADVMWHNGINKIVRAMDGFKVHFEYGNEIWSATDHRRANGKRKR